MFDGFLRVAAATPDIRVADCNFNGASAAALVSEAYEQGVSLLVLPELCLTGYTCSDLPAGKSVGWCRKGTAYTDRGYKRQEYGCISRSAADGEWCPLQCRCSAS